MIDPLLATRLVRQEWSRVVATGMRILGDLDLAQDVAQEALLAATERWPKDGVPANPGAWLTTVARRRALNLLRSRQRRCETDLPMELPDESPPPEDADDRLKLLLLCSHPSLTRDAQVALTLRLGGGLSTREIARGLVVAEKTVGQRISRAKRRLRALGDLFAEPDPAQLPDRLNVLLEVIYLVFNEGHFGSSGEMIRSEMIWEASMLADQVTQLDPGQPEVWGLAALIHFKSARIASRTAVDGTLVPLDEQSRKSWDRDSIARGERCRAAAVGAARTGMPVGRYVLQAEIEAHHCLAETFNQTDWATIDHLYETLVGLTKNQVGELAWAVARSYAVSPQAGLALLDDLQTESRLDGYPLAGATRADLLRRAGRESEAKPLYLELSRTAGTEPERRFYTRRLGECSSVG